MQPMRGKLEILRNIIVLISILKLSESIDDSSESSGSSENSESLERAGNRNESQSDEDVERVLQDRYRFDNDQNSTRFRTVSYALRSQNGTYNESNVLRAFQSRRIVGGLETTISRYPAHDGETRKLKPFTVRAGSSFHNRGGFQARVNKAFFPSQYEPGETEFDFALLRLDRPLPIGRNIAVINLPSKDYKIRKGDTLLVTGWGSTSETGLGSIPDRLRFLPVPIADPNKCLRAYKSFDRPSMLCAGYSRGGRDTCNHDSGGPAMSDGVLLGVVSFGGQKCGDPKYPGVYGKVSAVTDWIESTITENEAFKVPELKEKIERFKRIYRNMGRYKSSPDEKHRKIKDWLKEMLKSSTFLKIAIMKLRDAGIPLRRSNVEPKK